MSSPADRLRAGFVALVRVLTQRFDYGALYAATVQNQNADGTIGVLFDDPRMPPKDNVPLRVGLPGVSVKVAPGARVLVGFENQDQSKMRGMLWDAGGLVELAFAGGTLQVARATDPVQATTAMATWIAGVTSALSTLAPTLVAPTSFGTITSGAPKVKA